MPHGPYSRRLAGPTVINVAPSQIAQVPPLQVWLVRYITAVHVALVPVQVALFLGPPAATTQLIEEQVPPDGDGGRDIRLVFEAGETIWASSSNATASMVVTLQGFQLDA